MPPTQEEEKILDWVELNYGPEVRAECLTILREPGSTQRLTAELLEKAHYRLHRQDIDSAFWLGELSFNSD